jgi:hypothetical protein
MKKKKNTGLGVGLPLLVIIDEVVLIPTQLKCTLNGHIITMTFSYIALSRTSNHFERIELLRT